MLVFLVLLLILVSKRSIREEPRGVLTLLVRIMTLLGFAVPGTLFTVATADVVTGEATPLTFCCAVLSLFFGVAMAFKMSALFLAVDQYVAVVHCLHYQNHNGRLDTEDDWHDLRMYPALCILRAGRFPLRLGEYSRISPANVRCPTPSHAVLMATAVRRLHVV